MESLRYPSTNEWLMKMCYTHNENLFSCKENEIHRKNGLVLDNSILRGAGPDSETQRLYICLIERSQLQIFRVVYLTQSVCRGWGDRKEPL